MKSFLFFATLIGSLCADFANAQMVPAAPMNALPRTSRRPRATPAERRTQLEARLREMMQNLGVSAPATQEAVIAYLAEEEAGRTEVREAARRLLSGVRRDAPPERMRDLISAYQSALAAESKRRIAAQSALDAKIGFSVDTRLEAVLWLSGVLGEGGGALPMGALSARDGNVAPARNAKGDAAKRGQFIGVLEKRASDWIEVRGENGQLERFFASRNRQLEAFEPRVITAMTQLPLGARVRVDWERDKRRRILELVELPNHPGETPAAIAIENAPMR